MRIVSSVVDALDVSEPLIEDVALAIAADVYPGLDRRAYQAQLDAFVAPYLTELDGLDDEPKRERLTEVIYEHLGFTGNESDYYDPRNSYFNEVIERRTGIPITMAVLFMALGRRVGLEVNGIGFPGHFLVQVGGVGGVFVDAFNAGQLLPRAELQQKLGRMMPSSIEGLIDGQLAPVSPRVMAVRMLFNLQKIHERRGDHPKAFVVCDRLVDVADAPFHLRDRGRHALALGAWQVAIDDFEAYLDAKETPNDAELIQKLLRQARSKAGAQVPGEFLS